MYRIIPVSVRPHWDFKSGLLHLRLNWAMIAGRPASNRSKWLSGHISILRSLSDWLCLSINVTASEVNWPEVAIPWISIRGDLNHVFIEWHWEKARFLEQLSRMLMVEPGNTVIDLIPWQKRIKDPLGGICCRIQPKAGWLKNPSSFFITICIWALVWARKCDLSNRRQGLRVISPCPVWIISKIGFFLYFVSKGTLEALG